MSEVPLYPGQLLFDIPRDSRGIGRYGSLSIPMPDTGVFGVQCEIHL